MTNRRKIERRLSKEVRKKKAKDRQLGFSWNTLNEMRLECARTMAKNAMIIKELLGHRGLSKANPDDINRLASITTKLTTELTKQLATIQKLTLGRKGELSTAVDSDDFDVAFAVFDLYDTLTANITDQYASVTDAIYVLSQQLKENDDVTDNT